MLYRMVKANRSLTVNRDPRPYRRVTRICMACNLSSDTAQIFPTHALLPIALFADKWPATLFGIRGRFRAPFVVVNKKKKKRTHRKSAPSDDSPGEGNRNRCT